MIKQLPETIKIAANADAYFDPQNKEVAYVAFEVGQGVRAEAYRFEVSRAVLKELARHIDEALSA